ncbi:unnamed protein product [Didymodactylos carnosus]|uniref:Uncharacterized protein n=1 Tax=Didymodactylos carnosus TaxID=1234261 RepID=A0A814LZ50_9BILA|nr:unnamed protein product [Didymodactylos carnosus]CAF1070418.1 unnamed protein product [Didymodactylos carnosus]CAF3712768.1 unnamed protein product [Didymodactylos carnosus]CAF3837569.1 unnamed protein product [Didymodactylos carnosus]
MSTNAKIFFASSVLITSAVIYYVHYSIEEERQRKRVNIIRDIESKEKEQQRRVNMFEYEQQLKLQEQLIERDKQEFH